MEFDDAEGTVDDLKLYMHGLSYLLDGSSRIDPNDFEEWIAIIDLHGLSSSDPLINFNQFPQEDSKTGLHRQDWLGQLHQCTSA